MNLFNITPFNPLSAPSSDSALGILTKSCATPEFKGLAEIAVRRAAKYSLQNQAVKLLPNERVRFCLRHRVDATKGIEVRYNQKREQAHYRNGHVHYGAVSLPDFAKNT